MSGFRAAAMSAAFLGALSGCPRAIEGPTPVVTGTSGPGGSSPAVVCNAQGDPATGWPFEVLGERFAPLPTGVLTSSPGLLMPEVSLDGPQSLQLAPTHVRFVDATHLTVQLLTQDSTTPQSLAVGSYAVTVRNAQGATGRLEDALVVVPPPTLKAVSSPGFLPGTATTLTIDGTSFRATPAPTVTLSGSGLPTVQLANVSVSSPTRLVGLAPADLPAGTYDVTVTNADGCAFTARGALKVSYLLLGNLTLEPRFGWQLRNQAITLHNAVSGSAQGFSGGAPEAWIVAPLKGGTGNVEIPLRRLAFVTPNIITAAVPDCSGLAATPITDATCPNGIAPGGPYAIRVRDPSGASGMIPAAQGFFVLTNPPPVITSLAPEAIDTGGLPSSIASELVVNGQNFGANADLELVSDLGSGRIRACKVNVTSRSATALKATIATNLPASSCREIDAAGTQQAATGGLSLSAGLYVVRVQNAADPAYADYSGLVVTNPSLNPASGPAITTTLRGPRGDFALVEATDDLGQHFLYALGGSDGTNTLSSVEMAPITAFGDLGGDCTSTPCKFHALDRTPLGAGTTVARRGLSAVVRTIAGDTSYLYVLGGVNSAGTALASVERAQVLKASDAPELQPAEGVTGGALAPGTYYYRVAALRPGSDTKNPNGETLASDEQPFTVGSDGKATVKLSWTCVPGAPKYRIYRTVAANAASGTERLLAEPLAAATCSGAPLPKETYQDSGTTTPSGDRPLPQGALGNWVAQASLTVERGQAAARLLGDELYVAAGFCSTVGGACPSAGAVLATVDRASFSSGGIEVGTFSSVATLGSARRRHSIAFANAQTAPSSFSQTNPTDNRLDAYLLVVGGDSAGGLLSSGAIEVAQVRNSSGLIASPSFTLTTYNTLATHGGWTEVIANTLFQAGSTGGTGFASKSNFACPGVGNNVGQCTGASDFKGTLNNAFSAYQSGGPRYLSGSVLFRAFVYVGGGFPNDAGGTPVQSLERIIY